MVTHYEPYIDPEDLPYPFCGIVPAEGSGSTENWNYVTCKRCLKLKNKAKRYVEETEKIIVQQMGEFVEFYEKNIVKNNDNSKYRQINR